MLDLRVHGNKDSFLHARSPVLDSVQRSVRGKAECEDTDADLWRDTRKSAEQLFALLIEESIHEPRVRMEK